MLIVSAFRKPSFETDLEKKKVITLKRTTYSYDAIMYIVYYYQPDSAFTRTQDNTRSFHTVSSEYTVRLSK